MASKKILADLHVDGKVGVGTSTPGAKLQVGGTILSEGGTYVSGVDTKNDAGVIIKKGDWIYSDDNNYLRRIIGHGSDGNLEIGHQGTGLIGDILMRPGTSGNIRFFASGSEDVTITSSGNVGIGTTSPTQKLDVDGIGEFSGALRITDSSNSQNILIGNQDSSGVDKPAIINGVNGNLRFGTGDSWTGQGGTLSEFMRITTSGNVGIGTDAPSEKLHVDGNVKLSQPSKIKFANDQYIRDDGGAGLDISTINSVAKINLKTQDTDRLTIDSSGNVGINTTSPSEKLDVNGNALFRGDLNIESDFPRIKLIDTDNDSDYSILNANGALSIYDDTNSLSRIYITPSGNVGIGTASPDRKLHVDGASRFNGTITLTNTGAITSGVDALEISTVGSKDIALMPDGNVGIGTTSPSAKLQVGDLTTSAYSLSNGVANFVDSNKDLTHSQMGTINVTSNSRSNAGGNEGFGSSITFSQNVSQYVDGYERVIGGIKSYLTTNTNINESSALGFYTHDNTSLTERMTIDESGNVGIGTTSPEAKLDVDGEISIGGNQDADQARLSFRASDETKRFTVETDLDTTTSNDILGFRGLSTDNILVLKGDGNVGIGTDSPDATLELNNTSSTSDGDGSATETLSGQDSILLQAPTGANEETNGSITWRNGNRRRAMITSVSESTDGDYKGISFYTQGTDGTGDIFESMRIAHSGNVGIGTGSPSHNLHVANTGNSEIVAERTSGAKIIMQSQASRGKIGTLSNHDLRLGANSNDNMAITTAGNVGIGTTSPVAKLDVRGDYFQRPSSNTSSVWVLADSGGTTRSRFDLDSGGSSSLLLRKGDGTYAVDIDSDGTSYFNGGNVGIGTSSPAEKLTVSGGANVTGKFAVGISAAHPSIDFYNEGTAYFNGSTTVDDNLLVTNGSVGIGTTSPTADLHIQGSDATDVPRLRVGGFGNSDAVIELAETLSGGDMTYGFSFHYDGVTDNELMLKRHSNSTAGNAVVTFSRENNNVEFSGEIKSELLRGLTYSDSFLSFDDDGFVSNATSLNSVASMLFILDGNNNGTNDNFHWMIDGTSGSATEIMKLKNTGTLNVSNNVEANAFVKDGGTSSQYLMADGSVSTGNSSGVTSIAASTVDGKEGIDVTNGTSSAVTVGLDLDLIDASDTSLDYVVGIDDNNKNVKTEKSQFFAYNEQFIGYIIGDGTETSFSITHDLGFRYIIQVIDTESTSSTYLQEVYPKIVRTNGTTVDITFKTAPANDHNYEIYMVKINTRNV